MNIKAQGNFKNFLILKHLSLNYLYRLKENQLLDNLLDANQGDLF